MNSVKDLRREVLRLMETQHHSYCFRTRQLAAFYNLPERRVREEFADLAEKKLIHLSSWDGTHLRDFSTWPNAQEFIQSSSDAGHIHVGHISLHPLE